jgi:hypothetical protein
LRGNGFVGGLRQELREADKLIQDVERKIEAFINQFQNASDEIKFGS